MPDPRTPRRRRFPGEAPIEVPPAQVIPLLDLATVEWLERVAPAPAWTADVQTLAFNHGARSVAVKARDEYNRQQAKE